jgi:protein-S-isoprenylcysteine O-methyltransferase Ste14
MALAMEITWVRIYLVFGLLLHKAVWEVMKARQGRPATAKAKPPLKVRLLSSIKLVILLGIIVQTFLPAILPISDNPAPLIATGVAIYTLGLITAVTGRVQLGWNWSDIEKAYVKQDHALVSHGLYRHVRHPIYTGDLLLLLGLELALNSWGVLGALALVVYVRRQAIREESQLARALPGYDQYCRRTARFVPFLPV